MTQKELLYFEDAVGHEDSIIKIISENVNNLEDNELVNFINEEVNKHTEIKNNLLKLMEECANE